MTGHDLAQGTRIPDDLDPLVFHFTPVLRVARRDDQPGIQSRPQGQQRSHLRLCPGFSAIDQQVQAFRFACRTQHWLYHGMIDTGLFNAVA